MTDKLPTAKVAVSPIFKRVVVCRFQTILMGRMSIAISVKIFGILPYRKNASLLMHRAPGSSGSQLAAKGLHEASPVMTVDTVKLTRTPNIIQIAMRMFLLGNR